ncbi:MAG: GMC family oxidoreductase N-terminal domain-containing protein [Acidobacteriota bacterium]|nr:GMC family oxidoreductase N-terminal domain-containing protein [Acidobacteriota bacterium]
MQRLSQPLSRVRPTYDVVVIGSGYGGSVAASRMARCGKRVCVLERGREIATGEFPRTIFDAQGELQVNSSRLRTGSRTGLFDLSLNDDLHVLVGCGLGGTSLINANVALKADDRVLSDPAWPEALTRDSAFELGYERALAMLEPQTLPEDRTVTKAEALRAAANAMKVPYSTVPINVAFDAGTNAAGVALEACTFCGDCCSGCNIGAKKTTVLTWLPDAVNHGAEVFTRANVSHLERTRDGAWRIYYQPVGFARGRFDEAPLFVTASVVVLGAGSLGSTGILLRSRDRGLPLSERLGKGFTGNGDVLGFTYNGNLPVGSVGIGQQDLDVDPPGPTITGAVDLRNTDAFRHGMIIEEGAIPSPLAPLMPLAFKAAASVSGKNGDGGVTDWLNEHKDRIESLIQGSYEGAVHNTQVLLTMAHDDGAGEIRLDDHGRPRVHWPGVARQRIFADIARRGEELARALGATWVENPISRRLLGENLITVHPLGGCNIATDRDSGVVDHKCRVFDGSADDTAAVHDGLYVCDGAALPSPVGVNPLLTISAVAERAAIHLAKDRGWSFDVQPKADAPMRRAAPSTTPRPAGVRFTERMAGYFGEGEDYWEGAEAGRKTGSSFAFVFSISVDDVERMLADPAHEADLFGSVDAPAVSESRLIASGGRFNLFSADPDDPRTKRMEYRATLTAEDGAQYEFRGHKVVRDDPGFDLWPDTTTLYIELRHRGAAEADPPLRGVLRIAVADFARQLTTMQPTGSDSAKARAKALADFGGFFAGSLFRIYGGVGSPLQRFDEKAPPRTRRPLRCGVGQAFPVTTEDGKQLRLTRYRGGDRGPVVLTHGLGVSSLIFSIDTVATNLLEYLFEAGYDCWLLDYRSSIDLPHSGEPHTADDIARHDYPAAIATVREVTKADGVQIVAHCFGATTFTMAMLSGLQGVRSAVISQIGPHVFVPWFPQRLLAHLRIPWFFGLLRLRAVDVTARERDPRWLRALDRLLYRLLPLSGRESADNATSNRITALYGPLYERDQLNGATFDEALPEMFGEANVAALAQLALIARRKHIVDAEGRNRYLPGIEGLNIPIAFIHGAENRCFLPRSTGKTVRLLRRRFDPAQYARHVIPKYGHIDCIFGKDAVRDVYPLIRAHLDAT